MNDKRLTSFQLNVPPQIDFLTTDNTDRFAVVHKIGANANIGTSVEDIQTNGGFYSWSIDNFKVEVLSTDAADDVMGSGGRSVLIIGLTKVDGNLFDIIETIPLTGLTPSIGKEDFFRVNNVLLVDSGTYANGNELSHKGTITVQAEGGGEIQGQLILDSGLSIGIAQIARFSTPSDARAYLQGLIVSTASNKVVKYFIFARPRSNVISPPFSSKRLILSPPPFIGNNPLSIQNPLEFQPNTDVWFCGVGLQGQAS